MPDPDWLAATDPAQAADPSGDLRRRVLGTLALCFFCVHGGQHALSGHAYEALWSCTLSNALIGLGLLLARPVPAAIGVTWLCMGNLTWLADLALGGELLATSVLTHVGGLTVGVLGLRGLGWPRRAWLWSTAGMLALQQLSRLVTPAAANVNLAFSIYTGWERVYPSYRVFWLILFAEAVLVYGLADRLFRRLLRRGAAA